MSGPKPEVLPSEEIMGRLRNAAEISKRGQKRLETLHRLQTACDDIASGQAVKYAEKAGEDTTPFRILPRRIHATVVGKYINLRRRLAREKGDKLWPGPHESTLRADKDLMLYLAARQAEVNGSSGRQKPRTPRSQALNEIILAIPDPQHRLQIILAIEEGREARRKLQLASAAVSKLWAIDIDAVIAGNANPRVSAGRNSDLTDADQLALHRLVSKLTNNTHLADFNMTCDGQRIKMRGGTGAALISRDELTLLRSLAQSKP